MAFYDNILFYLWDNSDNHDKIYGAVIGGNHVYLFYGKRNPIEKPKEKTSITVKDVISENNIALADELFLSADMLFKKIEKGYRPLFISDLQIRGQPGYNEPISSWKISNLKRKFNYKTGYEAENVINSNYSNFENTIKKKLAKRILIK